MRRALPLLFLLAGCREPTHGGTIVASVIGRSAGPAAGAPPAPLAQATDAGLVRLDRDGQVIGAAAVRWAILDDGLDYVFRIDGEAGVSAATAARRLRTALKASVEERVRALAGTIESVQAVTATVLEIRLSAPQTDLLPLLARPEMAFGASGPFRPTPARGAILLQARPGPEPRPSPVLLRVERVGPAVARFAAGRSMLVLGGGFADLPVARAAQLSARDLRFDPATGLFGFVAHDPAGPYADPAVREALSLAIDRDRLVAAIGAPGLVKATTLGGSVLEPPLAERRVAARAALGGRTLPPLRVAMPPGPGARLLFALVAQDWARIGVTAQAVPADARADLALIDRVTPPGSRAAMACAASRGCDPADRLALLAPPYIPLASPVRWSLVARDLDRFAENALAAHPLDQLR